MGLLDIFKRRHKSGYGDTYSAIVSCLKRSGVKVGGTSSYPRVEVYNVTEGERLDKSGALRSIEFAVDSVSSTSLQEAVKLNEDNMALLGSSLNLGKSWQLIDCIPTTLNDSTEVTDSSTIIYRITQRYKLIISSI